jgi:hypothetical protein
MGRKGLESIENVGPRLAEVVEGLLAELSISVESGHGLAKGNGNACG